MRLLVPLPPGPDGVGGFLLGPRRDGRLYTRDDAELLEALAAPAMTALANARAWDALEALRRGLADENVWLRAELRQRDGFEGIVGQSPALREVLAQIEQVAPTDASVLLLGETGSGKELLVRALHRLSRRSERALVKVACAAIPETLLESEFFGHERGAFTGASAARIGRLEVADGGTLFLDDVDTLPFPVQAKLLRALQEGEIQRLGGSAVQRVDVRVVAATNRDLEAEVAAGRFRQDLYYRLAVVPIRVPPLRERREDLPLLVQHFLDEELGQLGAGAAADRAGRARRDRNASLARQRARAAQHRPACGVDEPGRRGPAGRRARAGAARSEQPAPALDGRSLAETVRAHKIAWIEEALAATGGHQGRAAARLGLHRQSLTRMMRELSIRGAARSEPRWPRAIRAGVAVTRPGVVLPARC